MIKVACEWTFEHLRFNCRRSNRCSRLKNLAFVLKIPFPVRAAACRAAFPELQACLQADTYLLESVPALQTPVQLCRASPNIRVQIGSAPLEVILRLAAGPE